MGKHPVAKDYIRVAVSSPLMEGLSDWVVKGYAQLNNDGTDRSAGPHAWRFWLKGAKKGELICGLSSDSSDRIGRPFPLLVMGQGRLKGWERHWGQLPVVLEPSWGRMEYIAAHRFSDIDDLAASLSRIKAPVLEKGSVKKRRDDLFSPSQDTELRHRVQQIRNGESAVITLADTDGRSPLSMATYWHEQLADRLTQIPRAVFLGGSVQKTFLVLMDRPLSPDAFARLWQL